MSHREVSRDPLGHQPEAVLQIQFLAATPGHNPKAPEQSQLDEPMDRGKQATEKEA